MTRHLGERQCQGYLRALHEAHRLSAEIDATDYAERLSAELVSTVSFGESASYKSDRFLVLGQSPPHTPPHYRFVAVESQRWSQISGIRCTPTEPKVSGSNPDGRAPSFRC
jgi:hypothetical protein